jgi:hypothetical protein
MKYAAEITWYLFWALSIAGSYYASLFAIRYFENNWKVEADNNQDSNNHH